MSEFSDMIEDDYEIFDDTQTITLANSATVSGVSKSKLSWQQTQLAESGNLQLNPTARSFSIPLATLGANTIQLRDTFTDEHGNPWIVETADLAVCDTCLNCICQIERV